MRWRWLDLLRTIAIVGMIVYHGAFDLQWYAGWMLDVTSGWWRVFQVCVAGLFLIVSGISAAVWTRSNDAVRKGWHRGWRILAAAMLVSAVTAIADPATWVRFGVLHLIALAAFVLPFLRALHPALLGMLSVLCVALTPLDLMPHMTSVDYMPPIPWMAWILAGFAIGKPLTLRPHRPPRPSAILDTLALPGRYALWVYLAHQPILLGILWLSAEYRT